MFTVARSLLTTIAPISVQAYRTQKQPSLKGVRFPEQPLLTEIHVRKYSTTNFDNSNKEFLSKSAKGFSRLLLLGLIGAVFWRSASESRPTKSLDILDDSNNVKLVVFVPIDPDPSRGDQYRFVNAVRDALGEAGAGYIGGYRSCSFSVEGTSRFMKPVSSGGENSNNEIISLKEVRIEVVCAKQNLQEAIEAARKVHPWEVMGYDIIELKELKKTIVASI